MPALDRTAIAGCRKLVPFYQVEPVYPDSVDRKAFPEGFVEVEIIIDRTGRARLPRIASATTSDFGWSAATAVSQWVFDLPKRGGQPVDVMLSIPFHFEAPCELQGIYHPPTIEDRHP
jgi:TonB family protein